MNENAALLDDKPFKPYKRYPFILNFFRLRPELSFSILWCVALVVLVYTFYWPEREVNEDDYQQIAMMDMVELEIPAPPAAEPEIQEPEVAQEVVKTQAVNNLKFGDDSGKWDLSGLAGTAPKLKVSPPDYPASLQSLGVEGVVFVEFGIDENGTVGYGKIVKGVHPQLDAYVLEWAKSASFYPAMAPDGSAMKVKVIMPINFKLQ